MCWICESGKIPRKPLFHESQERFCPNVIIISYGLNEFQDIEKNTEA